MLITPFLIRPELNDCCYYLHCPSLDYPVEPTDDFDRVNAANMRKHNADEEARNRLHLTLSATFVNLQNTTTNKRVLHKFLRVRVNPPFIGSSYIQYLFY